MKKPLAIGFLAVVAICAQAAFAVTFDVPAQALSDVAAGAVRAAAFYLGNVAVLAVLAVIALALNQGVWALYTLLVFLGLLYIGLFEQNITGIVWSGIDLSSQALIAFGYAMLSVNYLVAAQTIPGDHRWAWLKTPFRIAAVGIWALWAVGRTGSVELGYVLFSIAGCTVAVAHFFPVSTFAKLRGGYDSMIRNITWALLVCVLIGATILITGTFEEQGLTVTINRIIIAAITVAFGGLYIRNIFVLKSDRELAMQEALDHATEQARISRELLAAEENFKAAVAVAKDRNLRLATASHDIRQPITSLRTSFAALSQQMPEEARLHLQHSLDYLNELAGSYLSEANTQHGTMDAETLAVQERVEDAAGEQVAATQIGETLRRMFEDDAAEKGLTLRTDVAPADLRTEPLALMRMLCNLVSNAIAHGQAGDLEVLGATSEAGYVFKIRNRGAAKLDFEQWSKGDTSEGSGLGLAIVQQQASRAGLAVSVDDNDATHTCICVTIPHPMEGQTQ